MQRVNKVTTETYLKLVAVFTGLSAILNGDFLGSVFCGEIRRLVAFCTCFLLGDILLERFKVVTICGDSSSFFIVSFLGELRVLSVELLHSKLTRLK